MYPFFTGSEYRKKDIFRIIGIPENTKGGTWDTGYHRLGNDFFIFCNVGVPGRTGHDYDNKFIGDDLYWFAKNGTRLDQKTIVKLLNPIGNIYIFYRTDSSLPFTYAGTGRPKSFKDSTPVQITWEITTSCDEIDKAKVTKKLYAGATKSVNVNIYERNPVARAICIEKKGTTCNICGFDFEKIYGIIGKGFIEVHYLPPLSEFKKEHEINPEVDLIPVCSNCHAMLHRRRPPIPISELKENFLE